MLTLLQALLLIVLGIEEKNIEKSFQGSFEKDGI